MGPAEGVPATADEVADRQLKSAQETFPDWEIRPLFGGYVAVPKGTPVITSVDVDGMVMKIYKREAGR